MTPLIGIIDYVWIGQLLELLLKRYSENAKNSPRQNPENRPINPIFGAYVTQNKEFADQISDLRDLIQVYISKKRVERPLNILLAAPPGSGKSFLIKEIIKSLSNANRNSFEEVYVASLDDASELYGVFQRVQSLNLEGKSPFVFFDEIDAKVANEFVYAKFLAPMWDGNFYIGKEKFYLGRSVFFFAGSSLSMEEESDRILSESKPPMEYLTYYKKWLKEFQKSINEPSKSEHKVGDFVDRMDFILRIPPIYPALLGEKLQLEHEDLACVLIQKHFPKVNLVEKRALFAIVCLLAQSRSRRSAEKAVFAATLSKETEFDFECLARRDRDEVLAYVATLREPVDIFKNSQPAFFQLSVKPLSTATHPAPSSTPRGTSI